MGLRAGIVGLPNVGKSTIFNALTRAHAPCANYPFTTIEPNVGIVTVPDPRLDQLASIVPHDTLTPATIELVDIAGLVKGASHGEGLGNQFLSKIFEVDMLLHVVRCFDDPNVSHLPAELALAAIDPLRDVEIVTHELILKDVDVTRQWIGKHQKVAQTTQEKKLLASIDRCHTVVNALEQGKRAFVTPPLGITELKEAGLHLLTAKPVLYIANIGEGDMGREAECLKTIQAFARSEQSESEWICGKLEAELAELPLADQGEFLTALGVHESAGPRLIRKTAALLGLMTFFTTDSRKLRAWMVPRGTTAPQAAGVIHSDFERGFIRAEVIHFDDFLKCGSEQRAREEGLIHLEGKEFEIQDGDLVHFRFHV